MPEFWRVREVRAVDTGDEGERDEDGRDDRENLHDLIRLAALAREIDIKQQSRDHLPVGLHSLGDLDGVVIDIPEVNEHRIRDQERVAPLQFRHHIAERPD